MMDNALRAEVLVHALPYIKRYNGKIIVVKYGGNAMVDDTLRRSVMSDIALLSLIGVKVVLVHGGGPEVTETLERIGMESSFVDGLRVTDEETAAVVQMVLAGKVNKDLVNLLQNVGANAIGLCGLDGGMLKVHQKDERLGFVGEITTVNTDPITALLDTGYVPIISTVGYDTRGRVYNINADTAAAAIAGWLGAESLFLMTDISGILADPADPSSLIARMTIAEVQQATADGIVSGGMIPKTECCIDALCRGVDRVFIIDGTVPHALLVEMLTDEGIGTLVTKE